MITKAVMFAVQLDNDNPWCFVFLKIMFSFNFLDRCG